jgi:hypothetical protein
MKPDIRSLIPVLLAAGWLCVSAASLAPAANPPASQPALEDYDQIVQDYLSGNWENIVPSLAVSNRLIAHLPPAQALDIKYLRDAVSECRPAWWKSCKAKQEFNFRPSIWGRTLVASFDPISKQNFSINYTNGLASMTLMWPADDMDNPAEAEHGFSKGDLCDLNVWVVIGSAGALAAVPVEQQVNLQDAQKLKLQRYMDFNANLTGTYYSTPKARRWSLWLCSAAYLNKYASSPTVNSRKAVGSMFLAEVVANRAKYPSITLPAALPDEKIEENLCIALKNWIEKHPWTLAEDRRIRDQIKAFAVLNQKNVQQTNLVKLPDGLVMSLDPAVDASNQIARDTWLKNKMSGTTK